MPVRVKKSYENLNLISEIIYENWGSSKKVAFMQKTTTFY